MTPRARHEPRARVSDRAFVWLVISVVLVAGVGCHPRLPPSFRVGRWPERHFARTSDGWELALWHYPAHFRTVGEADEGLSAGEDPAGGEEKAASSRGPMAAPGLGAGLLPSAPDIRLSAPDRGALPPGPASARQLPIILSHGLACNHHAYDLTEDRSLARYLADRGYGVWLLELRGHGDSRRLDTHDGGADGWGIDEHALRDVPAAISYVRRVTGAPQVNWIGHSMGGMIIYAYLAETGDPAVRNVVALGAPGSVDFANDIVSYGLTGSAYVMWLPRVPIRVLARAWSHLSGRLPLGYDEAIWHLDNMSADAVRLMLWLGIEDIERGVTRSLVAVQRSGKLVSRDLAVDYQARLSRFSAPLLAIAGKLDGLAPPITVQQAFDRVGSVDKTYELISRANGYSAEYGHVDLVIGDRAKDDVFPLIFEWLEPRQPAARPPISGWSLADPLQPGSSP